MSKEEVILGPFTKGMVSGQLLDLDDTNAALDIVNYDISPDGSLLSRRPLQVVRTLGARANPIGYYVSSVGTVYTIFNTSDGVRAVDPTGTITVITANNSHSAVQYGDRLWIICYIGASGYWNPALGFNAVSGMPLGVSGVVKADRLLIAGITTEATVTYSSVGDFTKWVGAGGGSFTVRKQDGGYLQKITIFNDQVFIFKTRGIWALSFSDNPGSGVLRLVSPTIGLQNTFCLVSHVDFLAFYFSGQIMLLNNNSIEVISTKIADSLGSVSTGTLPTRAVVSLSDPAVPYDTNAFAHFVDTVRILFKIDENYWVYNIKSDAWARYAFDTTDTPGPGMLVPNAEDSNQYQLVCGGLALSNYKFYTYLGRDATTSVHPDLIPFTTKIVTKSFEFGEKSKYKRLFWWGVDMRAKGSITGKIAPITIKQPATWAQLSTKKWKDLQTWANPLGPLQGQYEDTFISNYDQRSVIKFARSCRLRRLFFEVSVDREATPIKLFAIMATVKASETVSAKES